MDTRILRRSAPVIILSTLAAVPAGQAVAASASSHTAKAKARVVTYKGPVVNMRWGPVQAQLKVQGKKIIWVKVGVSPETFRSTIIDNQAGPMLKQEVLQAQNANVNTISGATMTSEAFIQSLTAALTKAHLPTGVS